MYGVCLAFLRQHYLRYVREYLYSHVFDEVLVRHVVMSLLVGFDLIVIVEKNYVLFSIFRISNERNDIEVDLRGFFYLYLLRDLSYESE